MKVHMGIVKKQETPSASRVWKPDRLPHSALKHKSVMNIKKRYIGKQSVET
jgi:hypothetical protein